jgi:hypothetical protein
MGGTHEALEHAEHAQHQAHDPFDKRVAMTMAVVAACLASVTLLSHREHNQTILEQAEATTLHTQASDQWNFYQAKNIRTHEYNAMAQLLSAFKSDALQEDAAQKAREDWLGQAKRYKDKDLKEIKGEAERLTAEARKHEHLSHEAHSRTNFFDGGELFIELALVLCSIAILTKLRGFWYGGIAICVVGVVVAIVPFTALWARLASHGEHGDHPPTSSPETPGKSHKSGSGH